MSVSDVETHMRANPEATWSGDLEATRVDDPSSSFYLPGIAFVVDAEDNFNLINLTERTQ